jgi:hypothetical protein
MGSVCHALIVDDPERFNSLLGNFVGGLPLDWVFDYSFRR